MSAPARGVALALALALLLAAAPAARAEEAGPAWLSYAQLRQAGAAADKPSLIFFNAPWCLLCKKMLRLVFTRDDVRGALDQGWLAVKVDITQEPRLAEVYEVKALPFTLFLDPHGRPVLRLQGMLDSSRLLLAMEFVSSGRYKSMKFAEFEASR